MPPEHIFLGYTIAEWLGLFSIVAMFISFIAWLLKATILNPIMKRIEESNRLLNNTIHVLGEKVDGIGGNATMVHRDHEIRIRENENKLLVHEEDIKTLFKQSGRSRGH
ncbi:hypothetical protein [Paucilactobacillus sp. N302-9]